MLRLRSATGPEWTARVLADLDAFLLDHAACERKAAASAMTFVSHYPDRDGLVAIMVELAQEELEHFRLVYERIAERGLCPPPDAKDPYVNRLAALVRHGREPHFLDRLLVSAIIEARSCERLGLVAEALPAGPLRDLYVELTRAEARHHALFVRLARRYFE